MFKEIALTGRKHFLEAFTQRRPFYGNVKPFETPRTLACLHKFFPIAVRGILSFFVSL